MGQKLTPSVFKKKASKGPYKGKPRKEIALIKIKKKLPFTIDKTNKQILGVKLTGDKLSYIDGKNTKTISMADIQKDVDFGGQPKKTTASASISGKIVEVMSESFFCIYVALKMANTLNKYNKDETYKNWDEIQSKKELDDFAREYKILPFVETELNSSVFNQYIKFANDFLVDNKWHERLLSQVKKFFLTYSPKGQYKLLRADNLPKDMDPYKVYEVVANDIKAKIGFAKIVDKDKWNPADVWFFTDTARKTLIKELGNLNEKLVKKPQSSVDYLNDLNQLIFKLFEKKQLYPISLKAPKGTSANITSVNEDSDIEQVIKFDKVDLGQNNLDVKLRFELIYQKKKTKKLIDKKSGYLKSKTDTGGFRLEMEIPGSGARFGSLGTENYQYIIFNTDKTGVNKLLRERKKSNTYSSIPDNFKAGNKQLNWLGASGYNKLSKTKGGAKNYLEGYMQSLFRNINGAEFKISKTRAEKEVLNKTIASEIAIAINGITSKLGKEATLENLYSLATSQGLRVGISKEQLVARGEKAKNIVDKNIAQTVFDSCFHIKIY